MWDKSSEVNFALFYIIMLIFDNHIETLFNLP